MLVLKRISMSARMIICKSTIILACDSHCITHQDRKVIPAIFHRFKHWHLPLQRITNIQIQRKSIRTIIVACPIATLGKYDLTLFKNKNMVLNIFLGSRNLDKVHNGQVWRSLGLVASCRRNNCILSRQLANLQSQQN